MIADIPLETIAGGRPDYGDRVWVTLAPQDNLYALAAASRTPVAPGRGNA